MQLGSLVPVCSMDHTGKVILAKKDEIHAVNVKSALSAMFKVRRMFIYNDHAAQ